MVVDLPITCFDTLTSMSSRRAGWCKAGSMRLAWWIGEEDVEEGEEDSDEDEAMKNMLGELGLWILAFCLESL